MAPLFLVDFELVILNALHALIVVLLSSLCTGSHSVIKTSWAECSAGHAPAFALPQLSYLVQLSA
jgi:hypothetical protein